MLEKKLLEEIARFKSINKYAEKLVLEQDAPLPGGDVPPPTGEDVPPPGGEVPPPGGEVTQPAPAESETEEIDITDLVNMTKSIKKDIEDNKNDNTGVLTKMDDVFSKLNDLEKKLSEMDSVMAKIDRLDSKMDTIKEKTPQEKLELRSLDSYPFNKNPQEFFAEKQDQMRTSGKNEYVLTKDEVQNYPMDTIRQSFNPEIQDDEFKF
jgi:hypothetical protein